MGDNARAVPKIVMTLDVPGPALSILREHAEVEVLGQILAPAAYRERIRGAVALLPQLRDRIDAETLDAAGPQLQVVSNYAVGLDNVDIPACTERGVMVGHTPEVLTDATADMAMALLLAVARRVVEGDTQMRSGRYLGWRPDYMLGQQVTGATVGVVGFGRIGRAFARRAHLGFGMPLVAYDPLGCTFDPDVPGRELSFAELLESSDFVSCHVPLTSGTHHLFSDAEFARMRPGAVLVNTSRGPVVDEPALVRALQHRTIAGAGLDVYEEEPRMAAGLADCSNAVLAPHLGSATEHTRSAMGEAAAANIVAVLQGGRPRYWANPELVG